MLGFGDKDIPTIRIDLDWPTEGPLSDFTESDKRYVGIILQAALVIGMRMVLDGKVLERDIDGLEREDEGVGTG